ncbi:hydrolase Nlp/P60 [Actinomycetospora sp. NBRC 106375]|uniref:C40 family peptidase n=1 Tax=Actinomycetospora sp. NBRC 106375 TaxID=3032207 RepID=UPI0024A3D506|nr:C40 family peptidase [Actinomycetospora sp. NBRC 106375]GLZ47409.1 hydrolase Nlp/P60 [Actinomycetospora sp. NBRC 106375]
MLLLLAVLLAAGAVVGAAPAGTARADPIVPPGASDAVTALAQANARAADATEASMDAAEQLGVRRSEADRTRREADDAREAADAARAARDDAFAEVDPVTAAAFQGGQLDALGALLGSESPQAYLERTSLLDTISTENQRFVQRFLDAAAAAEGAERDADARATDADRSASDAQRSADDAQRRRDDADREVAAAEAALADASPATLAALRRGGTTKFPTNVPGSGIAVEALRAALTQQGKPYVWGATGPSTFDCSGLVQWAYRQVGVGLPRVSRQQALVGVPVSMADARPGDLLFFNDPVTHVGFYVGDGKFLEAPQSGDVVKVSQVRSSLTGVRRIVL